MNCELNKYVYDCEECGFCEGEKKMTNLQRYKEEIENFKGDFCEDFVRPTILKRETCEGLGCIKCRMIQTMWLMDEYKEPEEPKVDWSKVAVDTPILVRNCDNEVWRKRHFAKYEDGKVYAWNLGGTSWTGTDMMAWKYAKLAEQEESDE